MKNISSFLRFNFIERDFSKSPEVGDIAYKDGKMVVYMSDGNIYEVETVSFLTEPPKEKTESKQLVKAECSSCGGILIKGDDGYFCPYCNNKYIMV